MGTVRQQDSNLSLAQSIWSIQFAYIRIHYSICSLATAMDCAELFQVTNGELPSTWQYAFFGFESQLNAIWGYDELVNVPEYFDDLSNLEEPAELTFWKRKQEIDNLYSSRE
jgi:hypothetical protein